MKVVIFPEDGQPQGDAYLKKVANDWHIITLELKAQIEAKGWEFHVWPVTFDCKAPDVLAIYNGIPSTYHPPVIDKSILMIQEPPCVKPRLYDRLHGWPMARVLTFVREFEGVDGENPEEFLKTIDCYVMGARTYELALKLGWVYGDTPTIVVTHRDLPLARPTVELYSGDLKALVNERLKPRYRSIWVVGGASLVRDFLRAKLVQDIRLAILPVILGGGLPFFDAIGAQLPLHLKKVTGYKTGIVELWYEVRGNAA